MLFIFCQNAFIKVTLHGNTSNKMAIGSWIELYAGSKHLTHYTFCGENYLGQNSQHHIFGLGQITLVDSIVVTFPSGIVDKYTNVAVNQSYDFTESDQLANQILYDGFLSFCEGDSVVLDAGNYDSFLWSNGANTRYITVTQSGYYWVDVVSTLGMILYSDTLYIEVVDEPQISIDAQSLSCYGINDGSIILDIVNQTNDYTVTWNLGLQGDTLYNLAEGNYTYEYNDIFGCYHTDSIYILSPYAMVVISQVTGYSTSGMGSIYSIINGGTPPYEIYLDSILQGILIDSLLPGFYYYQVIDANGCIFSNTIQIVDYTVTETVSILKSSISFENPMIGNTLTLNCSENIIQVIVYNALGAVIPTIFENNILKIEGNYSGIFYLKVKLKDQEKNFKIMKL